MSRRWPPVAAALALVALTAVAYGPAYRAEFIWDDDDYVTDNAALDSFGGLVRIWTVPGAVPQYYPLTFTSFWVEHRVFGDAPLGYHVTNVALHALNALLAWLVLVRLGIPGAWLAAAIFAVHPVHVESVAWVTERKNVLSGACYLGALLAALAFAAERGADQRRRHAAVAVALFVAALLSKTVTCSLPAILLLLAWWRRGRIARRDLVATAPLFALGIALALVTIWMERTHVGATGALFDLSPAQRLLIAGRALWFYVATLVWPHPLSFVYPRWVVDAGVWWQWLPPLAAAAALAALWLARNRIGRAPFAAAAGFALTLTPALGFIDVYPMRYTFVADHYQYLASLFVIAPLAAALTIAGRRLGSMAPAAALPMLALLAVLTWRHATVLAGPETLWRDVIAKDPRGTMARVNLGMWLYGEGRAEEAVAALQDALRLEPNDAEVHGNVGIVLASLGRRDAAREHLERALALSPESAQAHSNLGNLLAAEGRLDEAVAHYLAAVRIDHDYADALNNLANVLVQQGKTDEAIARYEAALAADPSYLAAHHNLATVLTRVGRNAEAIAHYRAALALDPSHADAHRGLGAQLAARGQLDEAITELAAAARLRPGLANAHYEHGAALAAAGRLDEAIAAYGRAIALTPNVPDLHNDLGIAFARRGDLDAAAAEFRKAVALAPDHAEAVANLAAALAPRLPATP
jgi:tetratricopeptide (TPR) repeat protein